jgi:uncharacterized protein YjbJ (UPF0337 family)
MGTLEMRIRAATEQVSGRVKTAIGKLTGDQGLLASGKLSTARARVKTGIAKALGWTRGAWQAGLGAALQGVGKLTRSRDMQAAGVVKEVEGEAGKAAS